VQAFLDAVDDYLQPFVSRREQARALREAVDPAAVRLTVDSTFTSLHAEFTRQPGHELFVVYEDARSSQPTRVRAFRSAAAGGAVIRWPQAEAPFHRLRLPDAFVESFPDCRAGR
jgi:hypothetical protein